MRVLVVVTGDMKTNPTAVPFFYIFFKCGFGFIRPLVRWKIKLDNDREIEIDNRWIAPYNSGLLKKYRYYINVECCDTIAAVKYLFKYIHKSHDKIILDLKNENNQIEKHIAGRYLGSTETVDRINEFKLAHN